MAIETTENIRPPSRGTLGYLFKNSLHKQISGCSFERVDLAECERGISCVVYPEGVWYTLTGEENIPELLEHLRSGTVAEELLMTIED